jgi:Holliday junction resolvase
MVKIEGANPDVVKELMKVIELSGFDVIRNSKHKPKLLLDKISGRWRVFLYIHEELPVKIDEALMTVEGI